MGDDTNGDGVGDDTHSWGYDGAQGKKWHGGSDVGHTSYGGAHRWSTGDVIGCLLDIEKGIVSFTLNGEALGVAFNNVTRSNENKNENKKATYYPACSLEANQSLRINLGQRSFAFDSVVTSENGFVPVWESRPREDDDQDDDDNVKQNVKDEKDNVQEKEEDIQMNQKQEPKKSVKQMAQSKDVAQNQSITEMSKKLAKQINAIATGKGSSKKKIDEIEMLGMEKLKELLQSKQVKCGGDLKERADRWKVVQHLSDDEIPKQLRVKKRRPRKQ